MSGLVSGITKVFTTLGSGVAKLGSAVRGVGSSLFTAGAATGASVASQAASGGGILSRIFGSGSTLGNILSGAANVMATGPAGVITAATAAPAAAVTGLASGGGPVAAAATSTGLVPTGVSAATSGGLMKGLGNFLGTEGGANLLAGIGSGIGEYQKAQTEEDIAAANRQAVVDRDKKITEGYDVPMSALAGGTPSMPSTPLVKAKTMWKYNPQSGQIETVAA